MGTEVGGGIGRGPAVGAQAFQSGATVGAEIGHGLVFVLAIGANHVKLIFGCHVMLCNARARLCLRSDSKIVPVKQPVRHHHWGQPRHRF